jgi:cytochrome c-type biogenesis protein CcmH
MVSMILWVIFALMTAAAILAVVWPLGRTPRAPAGGSDLAVYKDQLSEIDSDRASGLIGEAEAEAARLEISRRLLAAAETPSGQTTTTKIAAAAANGGGGGGRKPVAAVAALVILTLGPLAFYIALGSPNVPGEPAFARVTTPKGHESIASLVSQVEARLAASPNDGAGWEVIAPVYARLGRFDDAVKARKQALLLNGATATREADLGEAEAAAANGVVTVEARTAFEAAVALDPKEAKARYFLGLAAEQDGRNQDAAALWRSMLAEAPAGAPWAAFVRQELARLPGAPVASAAPSAGDILAAADMSADARRDTIRGMVTRLADRLHDHGADVEGWLRLVRAYVVLGDRGKAKEAAAEARRALGERPDDVRRIDDLVKGLGLEG